MSDPLISLCMIVKNEAASLPRCLQSVKGIVDEMIVVDTGSTDDTVSIALSFGASIVHAAWQNDFAAARNAGLEVAFGRWILFLDADEALEPSEGPQLRVLAASNEIEGFFLDIHNYVGNGEQGATINPVLRMFRNRPQHRFEGRIHEQIAASIVRHRPGAAFHLSGLRIHHYGYQHAVVQSKNKVERNMGLLETALAEEPDNSFYRYNLGVEYLRTGRAAEALTLFRQALSGIDRINVSYAHLVSKYEIRCLQSLGRWEEALQVSANALQLHPDYTDLLHCKALCEMTLGDNTAALATMMQAIEQGAPPQAYHTEEGIGTYQTAYVLGELWEQRGEYDEALKWYRESLRLRSSLTPPLYRMFHLMRITGREDELASWLNGSFRIASVEALSKVIAILLHCRCGAACLDLLNSKQGRRLPAAFRASAEAEALMLTGALHEASGKLQAFARREGEEPAHAALRDRLRWLADQPGRLRDPLAAALASGQPHEADERLLALVTAEPAHWYALQKLLEAGMSGGRLNKFGRLLRTWQQLLERPESPALAVEAFMHSMTAAAEHHLTQLQSAAGDTGAGGREAITTLRLLLPKEDGL